MAIKDKVITVLNYNPYTVCVPTKLQTYILKPCYDNAPSFCKLSFDDALDIEIRSKAFKYGVIFPQLDEEEKKEFYEALGLYDYQNILTNDMIQDILLGASVDGLQRLLQITETPVFDRVWTILTALKNENSFDLSSRVISVIETRKKELSNNVFATKIVLSPKSIRKSEDAETLKKELNEQKQINESFQRQMADMQKLVETLVAQNASKAETVESPAIETADYQAKKSTKRGRPKSE